MLSEVTHAPAVAPIVTVTPPTATAPAIQTASRRAAGAPHPHHLMRASTPAPETPSYGFARVVETDPETAFGTARAEPLTFGSVPVEYSEIATQPVGADPGLRGLWRTFVPDNGTAPSTGDIPLVPGLAVVQMRVQPGSTGNDVTAVDQLMETGELVRTIAGPATQVASLVDADLAGTGGNADSPSRLTVTIRQGDRMVAVSGPSQALGSLLARVNAKRRY